LNRGWRAAIILSILPAALGLLGWSAYFVLGWLPDRVVYSRISLGYLLLFAGLATSLLSVTFLSMVYALQGRSRAQVGQVEADAAARRRQFLLRLDHELKNPLTTLQVEIANLEAVNTAQDPAFLLEQVQITERLKEQVLRLNDLVIQLRKLAELETRPIETEPVDMDELLHEVLAEFQASPEGAARQISLNLPQIPWRLSDIQGDADLVYLALRNVIGNAVKFTRPGDSIQVRAFEDSNQVIVEIADTGPGVPQDEQGQVWEELFRGKLGRSAPGSGLGLALVKAIVERHGGRASLRSRPNQGTIVTLRLPIQS
jgi:two-component system OmpR family sensor kinase